MRAALQSSAIGNKPGTESLQIIGDDEGIDRAKVGLIALASTLDVKYYISLMQQLLDGNIKYPDADAIARIVSGQTCKAAVSEHRRASVMAESVRQGQITAQQALDEHVAIKFISDVELVTADGYKAKYHGGENMPIIYPDFHILRIDPSDEDYELLTEHGVDSADHNRILYGSRYRLGFDALAAYYPVDESTGLADLSETAVVAVGRYSHETATFEKLDDLMNII